MTWIRICIKIKWILTTGFSTANPLKIETIDSKPYFLKSLSLLGEEKAIISKIRFKEKIIKPIKTHLQVVFLAWLFFLCQPCVGWIMFDG